MNNLVAIMESDSEMFITLEDEEVGLSYNTQDMVTFKDVAEAKTFAKQMLDDNTCYDVVNVTISIKVKTIDTINY